MKDVDPRAELANMPIYFGGSDDQPAAYVEVNVFGRSVPSSAWEKLTQDIMAALNSTLGVPEDRIYIRYTAPPTGAGTAATSSCYILAPGGGVVERSETEGEWSAMALPPVSFTANSSADYWLTVVCLSATNSPTRLFA
ncbi:4-oxalocrotonate tautomerase [Bifidobacterium bifidum]|nr:4-oxalocrotonate tautomerase [Bifidobacterium bifidum]